MELLAFVALWPLLILVIGFTFLAMGDIAGFAWTVPAIILLIVFVFGIGGKLGGPADGTSDDDRDRPRRGIIAFSMALFLPIFVKYFLALAGRDLLPIIISLVFAFAMLAWGMFVEEHKVITYANSVGGTLTIIYLYFQLWSLGQLAQVIASAFALLVAVVLSVVKFREKLK